MLNDHLKFLEAQSAKLSGVAPVNEGFLAQMYGHYGAQILYMLNRGGGKLTKADLDAQMRKSSWNHTQTAMQLDKLIRMDVVKWDQKFNPNTLILLDKDIISKDH